MRQGENHQIRLSDESSCANAFPVAISYDESCEFCLELAVESKNFADIGIDKIPGIMEVDFKPYSISFRTAQMFNGRRILEMVMEIIKVNVQVNKNHFLAKIQELDKKELVDSSFTFYLYS